MKRVSVLLVLILVIAIMSYIAMYAGHFLLPDMEKEKENENEMKTEDIKDSEPEEVEHHPVKYYHLSKNINGNKQELNILEINPAHEKVVVKPVLAQDSIFGFESLSEMAARSNAYAAVNAGFFYEYGQPSGMVAIDGRLITASTGQYPVFILSGGKAEFKEMDMELWISYGTGRIPVDSLNTLGKKGNAVVYTPDFGRTNRAEEANITVVIRNNTVESISEYSKPAEIPKDGLLLTFYKPYKYDLDNIPLRIGEKVEFISDPAVAKGSQAYECGDWIVRNGEIVIGERSRWVGALGNRDPRTAIGIKKDGTIVLMTVDGRQPGHSIGLTGKELGSFLLDYGVVDAAMLDGGASTEMVLEGNIVNKVSYSGPERLIAGAIAVITED